MKQKVKIILDISMSLLLILAMGYQITGNLWHEIVGITMFVLYVIHCALNGYWFKNFATIKNNLKGKPAATISFITNILVLADMIILAITSIMISKSAFAFLGIQAADSVKKIHMLSAHIGFVLISVHVGAHSKMILNKICKGANIDRTKKSVKIAGMVLALIIVIIGAISSIKIKQEMMMRESTQVANVEVMQNEVDLNDDANIEESENIGLHYFIFIAKAGMVIVITSYVLEWMDSKGKKKSSRSKNE